MSLNALIHNVMYPSINVGTAPSAIAYDPVSQRMYVAADYDGNNIQKGNIYVIDTNLNSLLGTKIEVGISPIGITYDPVHQRMYVTNFGNIEIQNSSSISIIDTSTNQVIETIATNRNLGDLAYDPVHQRMYIINTDTDTFSILDTNTNQITEGMFPEAVNGGLAYDPVHQRMYVTNYNSANMLVIDTMSNTVSSIIIEKYAAYIAYDPVHQRVYVPIFGNPNSNNIDDVVVGKKILVVDTILNTIQNTIEIDYGPFDIVYDSKNRKMYVSMVGSRFDNQFNPLNLSVLNRINVINTDNNEIQKEIIVSKGPSALAYDPIYQRIYVTIFGSEDPNGGNNKIDIICS